MKGRSLLWPLAAALSGCGGGGGSDVGRILAVIEATTWHMAAAVEDLNGDGLTDIVTAGHTFEDDASMINLFYQGAGGFDDKVVVSLPSGPAYRVFDIAVGDLNLDGDPDVVVAHQGMTAAGATAGNQISVTLKSGRGNRDFAAAVTYAVGDNPRRLAIGDLDLDGRPDIAVATSDGLDLLLQDGGNPGRFQPARRMSSRRSTGVAIGDLDADGLPDLAESAESGVFLHLNDPAAVGSFRPGGSFLTSDVPLDVALGDVDGDGRLDIAVSNAGPDTGAVLSVWLQDPALPGDFRSMPAIAVPGSRSLFSVDAADLNGDGAADLVVAVTDGSEGDSVAVVLAGPGGGFDSPSVYKSPAPSGAWMAVIGEVDGDGLPDVVVANGLDGVFVHYATGAGAFRSAVLIGK